MRTKQGAAKSQDNFQQNRVHNNSTPNQNRTVGPLFLSFGRYASSCGAACASNTECQAFGLVEEEIATSCQLFSDVEDVVEVAAEEGQMIFIGWVHSVHGDSLGQS